jgi:hypothetical protein
MMAGDGQILVRGCDSRWQVSLLVAAVLTCGFASAQTMYKSRGENGEWIFSDHPPDGGQETA